MQPILVGQDQTLADTAIKLPTVTAQQKAFFAAMSQAGGAAMITFAFMKDGSLCFMPSGPINPSMLSFIAAHVSQQVAAEMNRLTAELEVARAGAAAMNLNLKPN